MDQKRIWDYYQGAGMSAFNGSEGRLSYLLRLAVQLAQGTNWTVLNIGTGNGWLERECGRRGWHSLSLDPSEIAIAQLQLDSIVGAVGLIERLPFSDHSFDALFCSEVLEHLTNHQLMHGLAEIRRVLKPGGYLIGSVPFAEVLDKAQVICPHCGEQFHRWGHHQSFEHQRIRQMLSQQKLSTKIVNVRAFPYFPQPSLIDQVKSLIVSSAGRFGMQFANPSLIFVAQRTTSGSNDD